MNKVKAFPKCPENLPDSLHKCARLFAQAWAASDLRPHPSRDNVTHWDSLISNWIQNESLPLLIRKSSAIRGEVIIHKSRRSLIVSDNSPAQWVFTMAFTGRKMTLDDIHGHFEQDQIPVMFSPKNIDRDRVKYHCTLNKSVAVELNKNGWKLSHLDSVGLSTRIALEVMALDTLIDHFRRFMSPSNMFLVPKIWAGLGELPEMAEAIRARNSIK